MALTDATRLADFGSGIGTDSTLNLLNVNATGVVTATSFVGSGSGLTGVASTDNIITGTAATFTAGINVTGVVTATSFEGDGSALTGVSGFATALSSDQTSILNKIFKTPQTLTVGTGVSVTIESDAASGNIAFVREGIIHVGSGSTLHIDSSTAFAHECASRILINKI